MQLLIMQFMTLLHDVLRQIIDKHDDFAISFT